MSSGSTLNLTTGRSRASHFESKRLETGFLLDSDRLWRVFLATFGILPVLARPVLRCQLARRVAVTPVPSPEALAPCWIALFDGHLGVSVADNLALPILTGADYKFTRLSRCASGAVAWKFSRIHHLPHQCQSHQESSPEAIVVPSGGSQRSLTASLLALSAHSTVPRTPQRSSWHSYRLQVAPAASVRCVAGHSLAEVGQ